MPPNMSANDPKSQALNLDTYRCWPTHRANANKLQTVHSCRRPDRSRGGTAADRLWEYLGLPLVLDHHREDLTIDAATAIISKLRDHGSFFLITYLNRASAIVELCHTLSINMVQLHGKTSLEQIQLLRQKAPNLRIIKSLIVRGNNLSSTICPWSAQKVQRSLLECSIVQNGANDCRKSKRATTTPLPW
jgi:phosphoribosylanthranilate isomerase